MVNAKKLDISMDSSELQKQFNEEIREDFNNTIKHVPDILNIDSVNQNKTATYKLKFNQTAKGFDDYIRYWAYNQLNNTHTGASTIKQSFRTIIRFCNFLVDNYNCKGFKFFTEYQYKGFLDYLVEAVRTETLSPATANNGAGIVSNFLHFLDSRSVAKCEFVRHYNVGKYVPRYNVERYFKGEALREYVRKREETCEKFLTYKELEEVFKNIGLVSNPIHKIGIEILASTGLRSIELVHLDIGCAECESIDGSKVYWLSKYKASKKRRASWEQGTPLRISESLFKKIQELELISSDNRRKASQENKKKLFISIQGNIMSPDTIRNSFNKLTKELGIAKSGPHTLRHTYAKILNDKGVPIEYIKKYLNHQDTFTTGGYIDNSKEEKLKKYKDFISIDSFEGHAKDKAEDYKDRINKVFENEDFQGMIAESQIELLEMVSSDSKMSINVMSHGICFLPELTHCPNHYTDINSCIEEHCDKFATTIHSIPFLQKLVDSKVDFVENLKNSGHVDAYERNNERLEKTQTILDLLKKRA